MYGSESPTNEISVLKIEPVELIASLFGVVDVLVDDKRGALGIIRDTLADLTEVVSRTNYSRPGRGLRIPDGTKFAKEIKQLLGGDVVAMECQLKSMESEWETRDAGGVDGQDVLEVLDEENPETR